MDELKQRAKTLIDLANESLIYITHDLKNAEDKAIELIKENKDLLQIILDAFKDMQTFDKDSVMATCKDIADTHAEGKLGKIGMPLRAAITGRTSSPGIFDVAAILGKEETCKRIEAALA
jgi:glutamyl-tRNA synthetase